MNVTGGSTDVTTYFALRLTASGADATGLDVTTFDLQYVRSGVAPVAKVDATALAATDSAHSDNKAIEIDATDQPGLYRVDWPDAAFAAGVKEVILSVKQSTCFTEHLRVSIDAPVNVTSLNGGQQSLTDLKDFADDGYDPSTNKVQGVVLVDTLTTYTGNTVQTGDSYAIVNSGTHGNAAIKTQTAAIETDTQDIQSRLPAALSGGKMDSVVPDTQKVDVNTIKTNPVVNGGTITFPSNATLASTTNITAAAGCAVSSIAAGAITATAIATGAIDADSLAADAITAIQSGLSTLTAAGVRTAVGLAAANLDTQLDALPTNAELATALGTADDAVLAAIGALSIPTASAVASAVRTELTTELARIDAATSTRSTPAQVNAEVLDVVNVDTLVAGKTIAAALRYVGATAAGVITDAGTSTETFKDFAGVTAVTVTCDASGNRSVVAYA